MSLKQSDQWLSQYPVRFLAGATSRVRAVSNTGADMRDLAFCIGSSWKKVSGIPYSYPHPYCWIIPISSGGIRGAAAGTGQVTYANLAGVKWGVSTITGSTTFTISTTDPIGLGKMRSDILGEATFSGLAALAALIEAEITATGGISSNLGAIASLLCDFYGTALLSGNMRADAFAFADIYVNESTATVQQMANAVLDAKTADHAQSGSIGQAIAAAGTAGDPWITELPGEYGPGTAGDILGNLSISSGGLTPEEHEMLMTTIPDSIEAIPDGVWDTTLPGTYPTGSAGKTLASAGSSADPWLAELPGTYPAGTAGDIVGKKLLRTSKYLGLQD
jgi:hypothetical protein